MALLAYALAALLPALVAALMSHSWRAALLAALSGVVGGYLFLPVLAPNFLGFPALAVLGAAFGVVGFALETARGVSMPPVRRAAAIAVACLVWLMVAPFITTSPIFHAARHRALIGPVDTLTNTPDLAPVDPSRLRVVDGDIAAQLAERILGERGALASQVNVGIMDLQIVRGEWYWVAPLVHASFFRWLGNRGGTTGYVMISAVDPRDIRLVTSVNGQPLALRYNPGASFGDEPARHLYQSGYATRGVIDVSFEVDDTGRPYYVATEIAHRVGFGGAVATAALLLDAQTGAVTRCAIATCPAWVDLIQPAALMEARVQAWGEYVHGWFNPSKREQLQPTGSGVRILGKDGRQYHYTGVKSANADKGTTGFVLFDTRTGQARYYRQPGAMESAAIASAAGTVQEKGYVGTAAIPYLINGIWTYLVPLKDQAGFVKAVGFVSVANDQVLAVGDTPEAALRKYRTVLATATGGARATADAASAGAVHTGEVRRIASDLRQGDAYYYLVLAGRDSVIFVGSVSVSPTLPLTQVGDRVTVRFEDTGRGVLDLTGFENPTLPLRQSPAEAEAATTDTARRAG